MSMRFRPITLRFAVTALAAALLATLSAFAEGATQADRIRIAVVDFNTDALQNGWHYSWSYNNLARAASENLASELVKTGKFRVIERQQLDRVLGEQNLGDAGRIDPSTAARVGKILGVQLIVIGSVIEFGVKEREAGAKWLGKIKGYGGTSLSSTTGTGKLTARLVDTTTAEILGAYDGASSHTFTKAEFAGANLGTNWDSGMASNVLSEAVQKLAKDIAAGSGDVAPSTARGGLEGKIAKVEGTSVYLNIGAAKGLKVGDRFEVRRVGEAIVDPDSGEKLGGEETAVGVIEITKIVNEKLSVARAVEGAAFKIGDRAVMK